MTSVEAKGVEGEDGAGTRIEPKCAIGLMSGTSMDGIDVAALLTDGRGQVERLAGREYAYSPAQARALEAAVAVGADAENAHTLRANHRDLEAELTRWHVEAVQRFEAETGIVAAIIGFHGQTIAHRPVAGWTVQLGDGPALAAQLGRPVAHDFRSADMAAGGEGAPLVPVYHQALAGYGNLFEKGGTIAFLNVGGIANATVVRSGAEPIAFDCGPGNVLIDRWMRRGAGIPYDQGGRIASEGRIVRSWLEDALAAPFFTRDGPRSLDRLDFALPRENEMELADGARTLSHFTARAAADSLREYEPDLTIVCGGGRLNDAMMSDLRALIPGKVATAEACGLDGGLMEAEAFAYLAVRVESADPITFPGTTGCPQPLPGGRIARP